jgi:hypothetical protein
LAFIPVNPETGEIAAGAIRGMLYGRGTTIRLSDSPSELWPTDMTAFLIDNEIDDILFSLGDYLASAVFGGSGAVAITPDFLGYGESYQTDRAFIEKNTHAQAFTLVRTQAEKRENIFLLVFNNLIFVF